MHKLLFKILIIIGFAPVLQAQSALESLVKAEKAFAQKSVETTTKTAFLQYLSDSSIIFRPGPVAGKTFWEGATDDNDLLTWEPVFADVSAKGDLGYTTGPFEYKTDRKDEKPAGTGHFISVWQKQPNGEWKVMLDIGIGHPPVEKAAFTTPAKSGRPVDMTVSIAPAEEVSLMSEEMKFAEHQNKEGLRAYSEFISPEVRIYRPGAAPYADKAAVDEILSATDKQFLFTPFRAFTADSGDLGYVYGGGVVTIQEGDKTRNMNINYVRIWKKENGTDWKIVLDVVSVKR
jgi:ketosteroid isomerase-like protein